MTINWYPGHMHKANKEMTQALPEVDLIIEMIDARLPYSSSNPLIQKRGLDLPRIKLLSKSDLADPEQTALWQAYFERQDGVKALAMSLDQPDRVERILRLCRHLVPNKATDTRNLLAMITGIPNVGKSTLINALTGRPVARTGNEPAVTKGQQRINLRNGILLLDTPGILWPKIENEPSGYRLATTGALKDTAISHIEVACFAVDFIMKRYPDRLMQRYDLDALADNDINQLDAIGRRRGCLRAGGQVDLEKVSSLFINELRSNRLGGITYETPAMIEQELVVMEREQRDKAEAQRQRKLERRARYKKNNR